MARSLKNLLVNGLSDAALGPVLRSRARGLLLDVGCGLKPHAPLLRGLPVRHVGIDHPGSGHGMGAVDAASSAYAMPFRDGTFDLVLCSAVLEHLEEPAEAVREAFRVLRAGGSAVYTVPFIWHLHEEPRDFYRYSRHGLEYLFRKAGFDKVEVRPLSGFWATFGQLLVYQFHRLHRGPLRWIPVIPLLGLLVQGGAYALDRLDRSAESRKWTWAYLVVAEKPAPARPRT